MTDLATLGTALWGTHWVAPMARFLEYDERTIRRWANGQNPVPARVIEQLTSQLRAHHARLGAMLDETPPASAASGAETE